MQMLIKNAKLRDREELVNILIDGGKIVDIGVGLTAEAETVIDAELGWRDFFIDPQLQQLIQTALANNRDLRTSALNIESYQAQYRIQRSALFPSINGEGVGSKQRTLSGGNYVTAETYSASVGVTAYELDFFGRVRSLKDKALEQYLAKKVKEEK